MSFERLQKYLAHAGISSRRHAESLITAGRVRVDGRVVTELGTKVDSTDARVEVDGRRVVLPPLLYLLVHKPRGFVTTLRDPEGRPTVASLVEDCGQRVVPVGRLDFASSGVLLMTNDGEFQEKLQHPRAGAQKIYHAKVRGLVDEAGLERWRRSIDIDGRATRPAKVEILQHEEDKTWLEVVLSEGRNRQVRRLGDQSGHPVLRLMRVEYAGLTVQGLRPGHWRHISRDELLEIKQRYGVPHKVPRGVPESPEYSRRRPPRASTKVALRPSPQREQSAQRMLESEPTDPRPWPHRPKDGRRPAPKRESADRHVSPNRAKDGRRASPPREPAERRASPQRTRDERRNVMSRESADRRAAPNRAKSDRRASPQREPAERRASPQRTRDERQYVPQRAPTDGRKPSAQSGRNKGPRSRKVR